MGFSGIFYFHNKINVACIRKGKNVLGNYFFVQYRSLYGESQLKEECVVNKQMDIVTLVLGIFDKFHL